MFTCLAVGFVVDTSSVRFSVLVVEYLGFDMNSHVVHPFIQYYWLPLWHWEKIVVEVPVVPRMKNVHL